MSTIHPVNLAQGSHFEEFYDVYSRSCTRPFDGAWLAAEKRVNLTDDEYGTKVALVVRDASGVAIGGGWSIMPTQDNRELAFVDVFVLPEHRRRGTGTALLDVLLGVARSSDSVRRAGLGRRRRR